MFHRGLHHSGWIEVICGSMFSGKTEELIRRVRLAGIAKQKVALFKPAMDDRFSQTHVVSHDQRRIKAIAVQDTRELLEFARPYEVIGIDEAQFFGMSLVKACQQLADEGKRVVVSGLDQDYRGEPFEPIPQLLAIAEDITKNLAICVVCGAPANRNQRLTAAKERVVLGGKDAYEARCRRCHRVDLAEQDEAAPLALSIADG